MINSSADMAMYLDNLEFESIGWESLKQVNYHMVEVKTSHSSDFLY